jgi:hypothetical protein
MEITNCDVQSGRQDGPAPQPYAFTEQGVAMLSSVLNSKRAIQVNILIMRAFVKLREVMATHKDLAQKIEALERKYQEHDEESCRSCSRLSRGSWRLPGGLTAPRPLDVRGRGGTC